MIGEFVANCLMAGLFGFVIFMVLPEPKEEEEDPWESTR